MTMTAAPGIYLVIPAEEKSAVNLGTQEEKKLLKGKIISVGANREHDSGGKMIATYKEGDIIWFLNYVENYDRFTDNGQVIYTVLFNDVRAKVE